MLIVKYGLQRSNNSNGIDYLIFYEINVIKMLLYSNELNKKYNTHEYNIIKKHKCRYNSKIYYLLHNCGQLILLKHLNS